MARRAATLDSSKELLTELRAVLSLTPTTHKLEAASRLHVSESTLSRALNAAGTSFTAERKAALLDSIAFLLLSHGGGGQAEALRAAGQRSGYGYQRNLCRPFTMRYGITPGRVWRLGRSINALRLMAEAGPLRVRDNPTLYKRHYRRRLRHRRSLEQARTQLVEGTVVHSAVAEALPRDASPRAHRTGPRRARTRPHARTGR